MSSGAFQYIRVDWIHTHADEPTVLYSELDMGRWEVRKVEVYANGTMDFADTDNSSGTTRLGSLPVPPFAELSSEFKPKVIDAAEFEHVWLIATQ